jgi:rubrerythrin
MITFSADEIFEIAEQIERNGAKFYRKAAELAEGDNRDLLLRLAEMEDNHITAFEAMRDEYARADKKSDVVDADDEATLYLRAAADGKVFAPDPSRDLSGSESIKDILTIAVALEKDAVIFYQNMRGAASKVIRIESLDAIIKEEIGHILDLIGQLRDVGN